MKLYDLKSIEIINDNLKNIEDKGKKGKALKLKPNIMEYNNVIKIILEYIKKKKRIIYGGKCWEALLKKKNPKVGFYSEYEMPDYEFYSPQPINDIIELCDLLYKKGYKYVTGVDAQHEETYKLQVNYIEYCDISYMPKYIYNNMKTININGLLYPTFNFILIDILRIFNDPITSYWRMGKNGKRALELFKYYDINLDGKFIKINNDNIILDYIRKDILVNSKLIVIGYYAFNYFKYISLSEKEELYSPYYDVITNNYKEDINNIFNKLKEKFSNIEKIEYHPFYQFTGKRTSFIYNNKVILNIYENNNRCIPYKNLEKKNIKIGSFNIVFMYLLINNLYLRINKNSEKQNIDYMIKNLIDYKKKYLDKNNKTVLDNTPFQDFFTECIGDTYDTHTRHFAKLDNRNTQYVKRNRMRYQPDNPKNKEAFLKISFSNTSGNEMKFKSD